MISAKEFGRRSIRLEMHDYSESGAYFVTLCSHERECLFGAIVSDGLNLNELGFAVQEEWLRSKEVRLEIELDEFVIMPNHLHGIIWIINRLAECERSAEIAVGATGRSPSEKTERQRDKSNRRSSLNTAFLGSSGPKPKSLGAFVAGFKSAATKRINEIRNMPGQPAWQRNYYERIIRDEEELNSIREYIVNNPKQWANDHENPLNAKFIGRPAGRPYVQR